MKYVLLIALSPLFLVLAKVFFGIVGRLVSLGIEFAKAILYILQRKWRESWENSLKKKLKS